MEGTLLLILRQTSCTFETCANKSKTSSWLSIVKSEKDQHGKLYNIAIWTKTNCTRKVCEIDSGSWQRWLGWWRWRMIICKRPILLNDHLQEAGPSRWSFARGRPLILTITKGHEKRIFEIFHNEINVFWVSKNQITLKKRSKFSHLFMVRAEVADPRPPLQLARP